MAILNIDNHVQFSKQSNTWFYLNCHGCELLLKMSNNQPTKNVGYLFIISWK